MHVFSARSERCTLLIGDSITAGVVNKLVQVEVKCIPGADFRRIENTLFEPSFDLQHYDLTVIHAGTNEVRRNSVQTIVGNFKKIANRFRSQHPNGWLGFSCIIPRPCDAEFINKKVIDINQEIINWVNQNKCLYFRTFTVFRKGGKPDRDMFKPDMLHPSLTGKHGKVSGAHKLQSFFNHQLSDGMLLPRARKLLDA